MKIELGRLRKLVKEALGDSAQCEECGGTEGVRAMGVDANGEADGADLCTTCRDEQADGKAYDRATGRYFDPGSIPHIGY